jgi:hypothetical protein
MQDYASSIWTLTTLYYNDKLSYPPYYKIYHNYDKCWNKCLAQDL